MPPKAYTPQRYNLDEEPKSDLVRYHPTVITEQRFSGLEKTVLDVGKVVAGMTVRLDYLHGDVDEVKGELRDIKRHLDETKRDLYQNGRDSREHFDRLEGRLGDMLVDIKSDVSGLSLKVGQIESVERTRSTEQAVLKRWTKTLWPFVMAAAAGAVGTFSPRLAKLWTAIFGT